MMTSSYTISLQTSKLLLLWVLLIAPSSYTEVRINIRVLCPNHAVNASKAVAESPNICLMKRRTVQREFLVSGNNRA